VLVRRSLRGTDAVAIAGDELLVMVDGPMFVAQPITARLLAAVRTHRFTAGVTDQPIRLTLSLGAAAAPEHGVDFEQLVRAERRAALGAPAAGQEYARVARAVAAGRVVGASAGGAEARGEHDAATRGAGRLPSACRAAASVAHPPQRHALGGRSIVGRARASR